ncbi:2-oxo-4-hydroxy-4-carboxy-5-ureidoimidazoline decarboxylase [Streptomyces sp. NPDC002690]
MRQTGRTGRAVRDRVPAPAPPHRCPADPAGPATAAEDPAGTAGPPDPRLAGLARFNGAPFLVAEAALLECCGSTRWAHRVASYRPYPDLDSLLAASDEAGYDLSPTDVAEALAGEAAPSLHEDAPHAARLALHAAHAAYVTKFGYPFVICLDGHRPSHHVDQVLAGIRARLAHDEDEERSLTAEEMRRLARERIIELVTAPSSGTAPDTGAGCETPSPSVADRLPL